MSEIKLKAKVINKVFSGIDGYTVLNIELGSQRFRAAGTLAHEGRIDDTVFTFSGKWSQHARYGRFFAFTSCKMEGSDLFFFLSKVVSGIGAKLATQMIETFGEEELVRIISDEPHRLTSVKGIKEKKLALIRSSWERFKVMRELSDYLTPYGVATSLVVRIYNYFGDKAVQFIKANPYNMTHIGGVGFKTADMVAQKIGVEPHSPFRIESCIEYVMTGQAEDSGNTVMSLGSILKMVKEELDDVEGGIVIPESEIHVQIERLVATEKLTGFEEDKFSLVRYHFIEKRIKEIIDARLLMPPSPLMKPEEVGLYIKEQEEALGFEFSDEQRKGIELAAQGGRILIIAGYAGTGKSTIAKAVLRLYERKYGRDAIISMALSGIAADRIRLLSGFQANTIHSALKWKGNEFTYGKDNPLPFKVVLLDEASMCNSSLFRRILEALSPDATLILMGDNAQLPPIGPANPFTDLIANEYLPMIVLTKIYRQSDKSVLVSFANDVRQGKVPGGYAGRYQDFEFIDKSLPKHYYARGEDGKFILSEAEREALRVPNAEEILEIIVSKAVAIRPYIRNPISDFMVLAPMRKGILGVENLNSVLQGVMNPITSNTKVIKTNFGVRFQPGDRVVHLKNKNMPVAKPQQYRDLGGESFNGQTERVYNGNLGIVDDIDPDEACMYVYFPNGEGGVYVKYADCECGDIVSLAYALSVHKTQGSEIKWVVLPLVTSFYNMLNNKWFYTALTRAKAKIIVVGHDNMFKRACKNRDDAKRDTVLELMMSGNGGHP